MPLQHGIGYTIADSLIHIVLVLQSVRESKMSVEAEIQSILTQDLNPVYLSVENESHMHGGPATESHYKLTVVANTFSDLAKVKRHQRIYGLLANHLAGGVHALALHLYSPAEWERRQELVPNSPNCLGGSKAES